MTEQKELAIIALEKLDIYKPYVRKFRSAASTPCFFIRFAGFYADQDEMLWEKIKSVQADTGCLVYAVTHEVTEFGELWSMLCVPKEAEVTDDFLSDSGFPRKYYAYSYVWNVTNPEFSEFGDIVVETYGGGLRRVQ